MLTRRNEMRTSVVCSTNGRDAELAAFIESVVDIENESLPKSKGIHHPSSTDRGPNSTKMGQGDEAGNCILLERVYYFSEEDKMQQGLLLSEERSIANPENSRWSEEETIDSRMVTSSSCKQRVPCCCENEDVATQAVHMPIPEPPSVYPIYEETSTKYFPRKKNTSMETVNFKQCCTEYNSGGQEKFTEVNEAENAAVQTNVLTTHPGDKSEVVLRSLWSNHFATCEQVAEDNGTPPFRLPQRRTYRSTNCSRLLPDKICRHCLHNATINPCSHYQLQNDIERTDEDMRSEPWNRNVYSANAESLTEIWQSKYFKPNANEIRSQSFYNLPGPMQTVSPNPLPYPQVQPSNANFFEDRGCETMLTRASRDNYDNFRLNHQATDYHTQKKVAAELTPETWIAQEVRETEKNLQNLCSICERPDGETGCTWPLECYHDRQVFVENQIYADEAFSLSVDDGQNVSGGVKGVLPRSHFGFDEERHSWATVTGADDTSTVLRELYHDQTSCPTKPSCLVHENNEGEESFANVPDCCPENCFVFQESSSGLDESPSPYRLMEDERTNKAPIFKRKGKVSTYKGNHNPKCEKRCCKDQEINVHLHSPHGIVQRYATPTSPTKELPVHETEENLSKSFGEKAYKCDFPGCSRAYYRSSHLLCHQRLHTGERPFRCPWKNCTKTFRRSDERSRHLRVHTREKPYQCPLCFLRFFRSDHRRSHLRTRHSTTMSGSF